MENKSENSFVKQFFHRLNLLVKNKTEINILNNFLKLETNQFYKSCESLFSHLPRQVMLLLQCFLQLYLVDTQSNDMRSTRY